MPSKEKKQLRKKLLNNRKEKSHALSSDEISFIQSNLDEIILNHNINTISVFWPFGSEINIKPIIYNLWEKNYTLCLPKVIKKDHFMDFVEFTSEQDLAHNPNYKYLLEVNSNKKIIPEMIITPLLGFDNLGNRIGFGGGFYDKTLKNLKKLYNKNKFVIIGIAFSWQKLDTVPTQNHDEKLDFVITEKDLYKFGG